MSASWGFREISIQAISNLNSSNAKWGLYLPAAVVNTTFCLELILKSILLIEGKKQTGHNLFKLFRNLNKQTRSNIDFLLRKHRNGKPPYVGGGHTFIKMFKNQPIQFDLASYPKNLEDVFKSCDTLFVTFRYLNDAPAMTTFSFESEVLTDLVNVLFSYVDGEAAKLNIRLYP